MSYETDMLDAPVRHQQSMLQIETLPIARGALERLLHQGRVLRMNPLQTQCEGGFHRPVVLKNSKHFLRPEDFSGVDVPAEAAGAAQCLDVPQMNFAAPKSGFGLACCFGALAGGSHQAGHQQQGDQQGDDDQIDEARCGKVEPEAEADIGQQCQTDGTEDSSWVRRPECRKLDTCHYCHSVPIRLRLYPATIGRAIQAGGHRPEQIAALERLTERPCRAKGDDVVRVDPVPGIEKA